MWLFVFFDLPVTTKTDRKAATKFRKDILNDGFSMLQFSVYTRHCASKESAEVHVKRIKSFMPKKGHISILQVTDKQYGKIINIWGKRSVELDHPPPQLEMF